MSTNAAHAQDDERFALGFTEIVPWDLSYRPTKNLYLDKVGVLGTTRAVAVDKVSEKTLIRRLANGIDNEPAAAPASGSSAPVASSSSSGFGEGSDSESDSPKSSKIDTRRPLEPDNFVLRLHQPGGKKNLSTWAIRLIADNSNKSSEMECRGSMVIDQGDRQLWAWFNDLNQITDMKSPVSSDELAFNGAGFLGLLYPDPAASGSLKTRGALALCIHRNKGHVTDGASVGNLSHVLTFQNSKPNTATQGGGSSARPTGPGTTVVEEEPDPIKITAQPSKEDEALLRGDAGIRFKDGIGRWVMELAEDAKDPKTDEPRLVHFYLGRQATKDDKLDPATDTLSNHKKIEKNVGKQQIEAYVRVPKPGCCDHHTYDYSYHSYTSNGDSGGSSGGSDTPTGGSPSPGDTGEYEGDGPGEESDDEQFRRLGPPTDSSTNDYKADYEEWAAEQGMKTTGPDYGSVN